MAMFANSVFVGLLSAALYFIGYVQDSTFLQILNLPAEEFVKRPEDLIHDGFLRVFSGGAVGVIVAFASGYLFFRLLVFFLSKKIRFVSERETQIKELSGKAGPLVFLVMLIVAINYAVGDAMNWGGAFADAVFSKTMPVRNELLFIDHNRPTLKGRLIRASSGSYAFLDIESNSVLVIRRDIVETIKCRVFRAKD